MNEECFGKKVSLTYMFDRYVNVKLLLIHHSFIFYILKDFVVQQDLSCCSIPITINVVPQDLTIPLFSSLSLNPNSS